MKKSMIISMREAGRVGRRTEWFRQRAGQKSSKSQYQEIGGLQ